MEAYLYLLMAIAGEVVGTSALKASYGMTKLFPSLVVLVGYGLTFWSLSIALKTLPVGVVYAIWSGLGIVSIILIGVYFFNEAFSLMHLLGTALILAGVAVLMLFTGPVSE
ncbi:Quaternary ammonium compound-resistance protein QacF [Neochlamydia sp. TUME1]|uniref:DMT family transporter n=1 Tax=unclassified Neochlamydia TaxID=2643326 RepID=UPI00057DFD81|nr:MULTISPECIES: multidrug efflux SMR transporter [unclassified Neochlamydia]KIC76707.1 Quaternary ammonium compound-resistance protein QacF [Neochlamydia sp. TUME1]NGY94519.1 Quaternary ammonium compound-resistance protein QacF [Neochlamydia sp. AcF84]